LKHKGTSLRLKAPLPQQAVVSSYNTIAKLLTHRWFITKTYCEIFAKKLLPAARAYIAFVLASEYNLSQLKIARILGMKQPAVNYLVRGKRGAKYICEIKNAPELRSVLDDLARKVYSSGAFNPCKLCEVLRKDATLLRQAMKLLGEEYFTDCHLLVRS